VASASVIAVLLRGNFDTPSDTLTNLLPYIFISVGCALVVIFVAGLDRTPWRYSSVADHLQVILLTVLTILLALVLTFALNRLQPIARSLPVFQGGLVVSFLVAARSAARYWHTRQIHVNGINNGQPHETVLIMGVNTIAELFLMSVKEFASQQIQVIGIVAEEASMRGRAILQKPVLGTVEELQDILQSLDIHGVAVDRIVVTSPADRLAPSTLENLSQVETSSAIIVQFLSERLGFGVVDESPSDLSRHGQNGVSGQNAIARLETAIDEDHAESKTQSFCHSKRIVDVFGAFSLMFVLSPVLALVSFIVALDVGFPVIFWQQRPGLHRRAFRLYKFRTMRAAHDKQGNRIPDDQRSSAVGRILRRTRLDELPQLYNVLVGDMALVGPRPLLPRDQFAGYALRLSVRPGITGWAQVNGGRIISPSDKLILDVWYVKNASFVLDLKIVLRTVSMILFGDRINTAAVAQARSHVSLKTPLRAEMVPAE
jgi:lipopolysaccharide/colanic/teichoic acid biosynthesis glycosyltransferase